MHTYLGHNAVLTEIITFSYIIQIPRAPNDNNKDCYMNIYFILCTVYFIAIATQWSETDRILRVNYNVKGMVIFQQKVIIQ